MATDSPIPGAPLMRPIPLTAFALAITLTASSQTPVQPYPFAPPPGPQTYPHPLVDTDDGFQPIFDGTLKNWDGDPQNWRVENNILIGEVTPTISSSRTASSSGA